MSAVVVDTNVLVAGLLTSDEQAPTARVVSGLLARRFVYVLSEALLAEYREVLLRPKIARLHGLRAAEIDEVLTRIALDAVVSEPTARSPNTAPDPGDQFLWDLLHTLEAPILVTGETKLLEGRLAEGRALAPADFCEAVGI